MVTLSYLAAIQFKGADAGDFLHNQLSSDILGLKQGESTLACYCEPKGRVLSLMLVCCQSDGYLVVLASSLRDVIVKRLQMYVMRAKVEIDVLEGYGVAGLDGKSELGPENSPLATLKLPDGTQTYVVADLSSLPDAEVEEQDVWKHAELRIGLSWLGTDTSGEFLPQFLGFDQIGAVNYKKGCYPGQEIVARTHYLGKVKRLPRLLRSQSMIGSKQMEKIQILSGEQSFAAVTVDYAFDESQGNCLMVVTRMDPELPAEKAEYQDQTVELL